MQRVRQGARTRNKGCCECAYVVVNKGCCSWAGLVRISRVLSLQAPFKLPASVAVNCQGHEQTGGKAIVPKYKAFEPLISEPPTHPKTKKP